MNRVSMNNLVSTIKRIKSITILLFCLQTVVFGNTNNTSDQPNVIFFATDDLNTWVNPLGYNQAKTPNLDRLSAMGITFTNAHAPGVFALLRVVPYFQVYMLRQRDAITMKYIFTICRN